MEFFINTIEFISCIARGRIRKIDFCCSMTVDAPSHAQRRKLFHLIHLLNGSVTSLTLHFSSAYVLGMAEKYMIRKVMDFYPLHRLAGLGVFSAFGIISCIAV